VEATVIIDLPDTTTSAVNRKLVELRESGGVVALGRVMTLVIVTDDVDAEKAIQAANDASREHPCRVLAIARGNKRGAPRLDAQLRVGGDAGASEVVVLRLYGALANHGDSVLVPLLLPDAPVVVWWPGAAPERPSADPIGRMAQRRITDSAATRNPVRTLNDRAGNYAPGDTDLAWSRVTRWRALLAAALDQPPYESVTRAVVTGASDSPSSELLAGWLALSLRCPVSRKRAPSGAGIVGVRLERSSGDVALERPDGTFATLNQPGQPERRIAMPRRADVDCLMEELRRLDPDDVFSDVLTKGLAQLKKPAANGRSAAATKKKKKKRPGGKSEPAGGTDEAGVGAQTEPVAELT
jgi:glucose-6-phosphate dehydrogenase assembly protein OpcA